MSFAMPTVRASLLALAIMATPQLAEARKLDPLLERMLPMASASEGIEVIVSFHGEGALDAAQKQRLSALGLKALTMRSLPIAGTLANKAQIQSLLAMPEVRSVWLNAPLDYDNKEATLLTGVDRARTDSAMRINGLPVSGKGIGVVVNDSGVDGTHPDMQLGKNLVQNVLAQTNLASLDSTLPITYQENVVNTDIGGGHGTHVAGTVGGNGQASAGAQEGVAPGAGIIGYGSGAVLLILDTIGGFDYALTNQAQYNIRVISNSFGQTSDVGTPFDPDNPTNIATKALADRGVVVVFSAGNAGAGEGTITGNFKKAPWVVTVAAGDKQGKLASFSSRGVEGGGGEVTIGDETFQWVDRPTITAPGVDIASLRASLGSTDKLSAEQDVALLGPALALRYTHSSGTSMSAPHTSGIVALMLEANPRMGWREVKQILQETATNIPGRKAWEVGAGYVNAHAAVQKSLNLGNFGRTVNAARTFNANALLVQGAETTYSLDYTPLLPSETVQFEVGSDVAVVAARANVGDNVAAIWLTDPNGVTYKSSVGLPVLGANVAASAAGVPGTWSMTLKGTQATGTGTNGGGLPGTIDVHVKQIRTGGYTGLNDIATHPGRGFIEFAVANRLADGYADGRFQPDRVINRGEMADYLSMGAAVRQFQPTNGASSFSDLALGTTLSPAAEAAVAKGGALRNVDQLQEGVMGKLNGAFRAGDAVTRVSLAYTLVQSLGLQPQATAFNGTLSVDNNGTRVAIEDAAAIAPALRGYVQMALDLGLINARFAVTQGPFDLNPVVRAYFDPSTTVTRAAFAAAASRRFNAYGF
jgi:serine protease AprX